LRTNAVMWRFVGGRAAMLNGLALLLCPVIAAGVLHNSPLTRTDTSLRKVARLVDDIRESLTKSGKDASIAYDSLLSNDRQLSSALMMEINALQKKVDTPVASDGSKHAEAHPALLKKQSQLGSEELSITMKFARGTLQRDLAFQEALKSGMAKKEAKVQAISHLREEQMLTLSKLANTLQGDGSSHAVAFLQTDTVARGPSIKASIEQALKQKGNTHQILMQIKEMLGAAAPVQVEDVRGILKELGATLQMVEREKSHADEASKRCQAEESQRLQGRKDLESNVALMKTASAHAESAVRLARHALDNITAKMQVMQQSPQEYAKSCAQPLKTLQRQAHDRATIRAAMQKAEAVVSHVAPLSPTVGLFRQLAEEMDSEEKAQQDLHSEDSRTQSLLQTFADESLLQLQDEKLHYERSVSGLELYLDELRSDTLVQTKSLEAGKDLDDESEQLCDSIMSVIAKRAERRAQLDNQLRDVYPRLLDYFGTGSVGDMDMSDSA